MKALTKSFFKKELKKVPINDIYLRLEQLQNEYPFYALKILDASSDVMFEALEETNPNWRNEIKK